MKIILRKRSGPLPRKMRYRPINIAEAKRLADKYDALADEGAVTSRTQLKEVTGFGTLHCTLCAPVIAVVPDSSKLRCEVCIHTKGRMYEYSPCDMHPTYERLDQCSFTPDDLRARASYLRELISKYE